HPRPVRTMQRLGRAHELKCEHTDGQRDLLRRRELHWNRSTEQYESRRGSGCLQYSSVFVCGTAFDHCAIRWRHQFQWKYDGLANHSVCSKGFGGPRLIELFVQSILCGEFRNLYTALK